ncbi:ABC transporter ATP-binding protein [Shinella sp. NM-101]|uniref:ABC transporter ATP-binding protein n=1 Tax=Shinella sp. NM-101 TaxID=2744455 RepID=UPI001F1F9A3F|nr:ABC transporter ATP-binding protein [Shinella sp. NM-101]
MNNPHATRNSIEIRDLHIAYGSLTVLHHLNLNVGKGEFLVLLGPSGCGKSTLLNAIAGLGEISGGQIWIGGDNVTWKEPKERHIGMVFQSYALYPRMTVYGNMSFGLRMQGVARDEIDRRVREAARILQIEPYFDRRPSDLSGGQRQRVAIGRALVRNVDVFLFDEPLSNLDAKLRAELRVEIKRLHRDLGTTMIYVTHDQIEALTLADRVAVMKDGIIQQLDSPEVVYATPANRFVAGFLGSPGMNFVEGRLAERDGGMVFESASLSLPLSDYRFLGPVEAGQAVSLGVRPEHVRLAGDAAGDPFRQEARIELVEPMGADVLVWASIGATMLSARINTDRRIARSGTLTLGLSSSRISLFDGASGARL